MKSFLIVFYTFLLFFTAGLLASLPVSAETVTAASYALAGYTGGETDVFAPAADSGIRRLDMTAPWDFLGDTMHIYCLYGINN